jgi:hypothetical protein
MMQLSSTADSYGGNGFAILHVYSLNVATVVDGIDQSASGVTVVCVARVLPIAWVFRSGFRPYINVIEKTPSFSYVDDSERRTREGSPLSKGRPFFRTID